MNSGRTPWVYIFLMSITVVVNFFAITNDAKQMIAKYTSLFLSQKSLHILITMNSSLTSNLRVHHLLHRPTDSQLKSRTLSPSCGIEGIGQILCVLRWVRCAWRNLYRDVWLIWPYVLRKLPYELCFSMNSLSVVKPGTNGSINAGITMRKRHQKKKHLELRK